MKKTTAVLLALTLFLLVLNVFTNSILVGSSQQHVETEEFGLFEWNALVGMLSLAAFALVTGLKTQFTLANQHWLSFFYCGWQNSSYDRNYLGVRT